MPITPLHPGPGAFLNSIFDAAIDGLVKDQRQADFGDISINSLHITCLLLGVVGAMLFFAGSRQIGPLPL